MFATYGILSKISDYIFIILVLWGAFTLYAIIKALKDHSYIEIHLVIGIPVGLYILYHLLNYFNNISLPEIPGTTKNILTVVIGYGACAIIWPKAYPSIIAESDRLVNEYWRTYSKKNNKHFLHKKPLEISP